VTAHARDDRLGELECTARVQLAAMPMPASPWTSTLSAELAELDVSRQRPSGWCKRIRSQVRPIGSSFHGAGTEDTVREARLTVQLRPHKKRNPGPL
jgi:hypothetical protein